MTESQQGTDEDFGAWRNASVGRERSYIVDGRTWIACEVIDPNLLTRVLIFTSDGVGRRVHHYPPNWSDLPSDALHSLSWST